MLRSLIFKRFAHCVGCGNQLVFPLSKKAAFPSPPSKSSTQAQHTKKLDDIYMQLSDAQRGALNWAPPNESGDQTSVEKHILNHEQTKSRASAAINSKVCKHCIMSREGTHTEISIPHYETGVLGKIFHIVDALEFPMGIPSSFENGDMFVVNRCDLLVSHKSQLPKLKKYFMETSFDKLGVSPDRVILTSAQNGWHLEKLSEQFVNKPKFNYFVGPPSTGKTRLAHLLSGVSQKQGSTTWPVPFTTQNPLTYKALPKFRGKTLVDMPSNPQGTSALLIVLPSVLRKLSAGTRMIKSDPKYIVPKIRAKSGQVVSIGGIIAIEFPPLPRRLPIHVFAGIGGLAHTEFGHAFRDLAKVQEINSSEDVAQLKMRMHDRLDLKLEKKFSFKPWLAETQTRQAVVVKSFGFLQPFLFGEFPEDYEATVWAPEGTQVGTRPEILPYL